MHAPARVCNVTPRLLVLRIVVDGEHNFLTFVNKFPGMRGRQWLNIALGALLVLLCECKIMSIGEKVKGVWEMFVCVCVCVQHINNFNLLREMLRVKNQYLNIVVHSLANYIWGRGLF